MFPIVENDPFLKYRPFPSEPSNYFSAHWHEIFFSFAFYIGLQFASPFLSKRVLGKTYTSLAPKTKLNFDIHVVSMVQCIVSVAVLIPMWNHPFWQNRVEDPSSSIHGYTPYGGLVTSITVGYFVWDFVVCIAYFKMFGFGFFFHAVAALWVFSCCLSPFCMPWVPAFLLFELSTPFVNINWFATRLPDGTFSDTTIMINGLLLLLTFFTVRILWGFYAVALVAIDMYKMLGTFNLIFPITILTLNFSLDVLNVFWFYKMVLIAKKKASGSKATPRSQAKEIDKIE